MSSEVTKEVLEGIRANYDRQTGIVELRRPDEDKPFATLNVKKGEVRGLIMVLGYLTDIYPNDEFSYNKLGEKIIPIT
jgi:hypothetical protein